MSTPSRRTAAEIRAAGRQMDQALNAGMPPRVLHLMLACRAAWWGERNWPPRGELIEVVLCPQAKIMDAVVYQAVKDRVR